MHRHSSEARSCSDTVCQLRRRHVFSSDETCFVIHCQIYRDHELVLLGHGACCYAEKDSRLSRFWSLILLLITSGRSLSVTCLSGQNWNKFVVSSTPPLVPLTVLSI